MDLEVITVHEISQMEKDKYYMISLLRGILKSDTRASLYTTCRHLLEMRILRGFSGHNTRGWGVDIALSKEERWCDGLGVRALLPHSRSKWNEEAPKRKRMSEVSTRSLKAERWRGGVKMAEEQDGWSLSLLQIHWKNNRMVNKVYRTASDR